MKKNTLYLSFIFILINLLSYAQNVNIPDNNFKNKLLIHYPLIDTNNDGEIQFSEAEAITETIDVSGTFANPGEITDLTGIEAFINIDELKCEYNQLSSLSLNSNTILEDLFCDFNEITELDISNNTTLRTLSCSNNLLTSLDVLNNVNLEFLQCNFGILETLDVSNNLILHYLYVQVNQITNLDLTNNQELYVLICDDNQLTNLNLSNNINLRGIECKSNTNLTYINLKNGNNDEIFISGTQSSNFENLPRLENVCVDDVNSDLAEFILDQVGHSLTFTEDCSLSLNEIPFTNLTIYPIPTKDIINIQSETSIIQIDVYSLLGQLLITESNKTNINMIDTSHLPKGLYVIVLQDSNNNQGVKKIIKD